MNGEEIRELAAVYALGGLEGEDRARFERLLDAGDGEAVAALAEFESTLMDLTVGAQQTPAPAVREALMARIGGEEAAGLVVARPIRSETPARRSRRAWWPVAWAAAMAAGIAAIAVAVPLSSRYEHRLNDLAQEAATLRAELERQRAIVALIRDPHTQVVALAGLEPAPAARARMLWNGPVGGLLVAAGLPAAPAGKAYQLWAISGKNAPVSAGVFEVDARGSGTLRVPSLPGVAAVDVFAVTLEPAGGLPAPSGPMFLAGKS